jgi:hypothetical protein
MERLEKLEKVVVYGFESQLCPIVTYGYCPEFTSGGGKVKEATSYWGADIGYFPSWFASVKAVSD